MSAKARIPESLPTADAAPEKTFAQRCAYLTVIPEFNAAGIAEVFSIQDKPDYLELMRELVKHGNAIVLDDTQGIERMLSAQAHALDSMFANLARRSNCQDNPESLETFLKLALKAQSQCRATLETLATIKHPPQLAFVNQANIAHGPQQVNNGQPQLVARAEENANPPNELMGNDHGERLDFGTTRTAGACDPVMATVGSLDGTAHDAREGYSES